MPTSTTESPASPAAGRPTIRDLAPYAAIGVFLGIVFVKSEVLSWYRIQEMFRFQSFHMYGILGSASFTAFVTVSALRRARAHSANGELIALAPKELGSGARYWIGGAIFGVGWALTGACPGPLFALIGSGATIYLVVAAAALVGAWAYGYIRPRLPH